MITLCRNAERRLVQSGELRSWHTFAPDAVDGDASTGGGFGLLSRLEEMRFSPKGGTVVPSWGEAEIVTIVHRGALAQTDSTGRSEVIHAGEVQHQTAGHAIRCGEMNASLTDGAHVFRICLRPSQVGRAPAREQERFTVAQRRNVLCAVASPDGRGGSLRIRQDAVIYVCVLDAGHHLLHELSPGRSAWLHLMLGEARLSDIVLGAGDGAGYEGELALALTAIRPTELLLTDLGTGSVGT